MAQQKSEDPKVPADRRKPIPTQRVESSGGGKGIPVERAGKQLLLPFMTAENSLPTSEADREESPDRSAPSPHEAPKMKDTQVPRSLARMESVVDGLEVAFEKVAANKGAPGPDQQTIEEVRAHLPALLKTLRTALLDGSYTPGDIRRVWIPKANGGQRPLGIPNVIDRVVQEAIRRVLEPLYEPTFHPSSHGFRPNRGCHTAIAEARSYIEEGRPWVVDLDLEQFFDRVNHQRLQARLAQRVEDDRVLALIGRMLKAQVVMPEGVRVSTEEGVPQGGPLSPLLSNIVLSELDDELTQRGHRFVRYADDCNIYVRSERAGHRVMASISQFIERRMRLKVNTTKSAVARPETRHFLGYRLHRQEDGTTEVLLSERSVKRLRLRIRELTPRPAGRSLEDVIEKVNEYLGGWMGHFRICTPGIERVIQWADGHIRRRMRAIILAHWKTKKTAVQRLIGLGVPPKMAWKGIYQGRSSLWKLSHIPAVDRGLHNAYFADRGLETLQARFEAIWTRLLAPRQPKEQRKRSWEILRS